MGACSTIEITRADALAVIFKELNSASDKTVDEILYRLVGQEWLHNFQIVNEYTEERASAITNALCGCHQL